jgi:acetoin utilization protein AcuB
MTELVIESFMTRSPHTVGSDQTLATAHHRMAEASIRHLPVLEGGRLVGLLSARDLDFVETLPSVDPKTIAVTQAMSQEVYSVGPRDTLAAVAKEMADNKYGSAVVLEHGKVLGMFTTVDALRALLHVLESKK